MNGPEHYAEAERLVKLAMRDFTPELPFHTATLARAQVHANLAQAAALIDAAHSWNAPSWSLVFGQPRLTNGDAE